MSLCAILGEGRTPRYVLLYSGCVINSKAYHSVIATSVKGTAHVLSRPLGPGHIYEYIMFWRDSALHPPTLRNKVTRVLGDELRSKGFDCWALKIWHDGYGKTRGSWLSSSCFIIFCGAWQLGMAYMHQISLWHGGSEAPEPPYSADFGWQ